MKIQYRVYKTPTYHVRVKRKVVGFRILGLTTSKIFEVDWTDEGKEWFFSLDADPAVVFIELCFDAAMTDCHHRWTRD